MRDPGGELAEGGHLLGLNKVGLRGFQFPQRGIRRIAGGAQCLFVLLALGDVGVDQDEATGRDGVVVDLDRAAIGAGAFEHGGLAAPAG